MDRPEYELGRATSIDAEAVGQPGQRRFRLLVQSTGHSASIWMEKQQLAGIGLWLEEVAQRLDREQPRQLEEQEPLPFPLNPEIDFHASQIGLGFAEADDSFVIQAFDNQSADPQNPKLRCFLSRGQARFLIQKIEQVVSAGRKLCPLCRTPMEPEGHVCPRQNGHHAASLA
jgi:uncharacterized repeat protein (TIGR03847 family)